MFFWFFVLILNYSQKPNFYIHINDTCSFRWTNMYELFVINKLNQFLSLWGSFLRLFNKVTSIRLVYSISNRNRRCRNVVEELTAFWPCILPPWQSLYIMDEVSFTYFLNWSFQATLYFFPVADMLSSNFFKTNSTTLSLTTKFASGEDRALI